MHIVFFTHPKFLGSQSMPRYAKWLSEGMRELGHTVESWSPEAFFYDLPAPRFLKKWLGYVDQYCIFPFKVRARLKRMPDDVLYVFADQALGPWVPLVVGKQHVVHCHDFLAQKSALDQIPENPTSFTGKMYQAFIRRGYSKAKNFISISLKTRSDLHKLLNNQPLVSEVVYNGLTQKFRACSNYDQLASYLYGETNIKLHTGYILHVGGNQWYKNRKGVIEIYSKWRELYQNNLPLILVGSAPTDQVLKAYENSNYKDDIFFLTGKSDDFVIKIYSGASVFLFPSLDEGFGWPIIEAMASGTPVITTDEAPMNEVGGTAAFYIPRRPIEDKLVSNWSKTGASTLQNILTKCDEEKKIILSNGIKNANKYDSAEAIGRIETIYKHILETEKK